jgi:RNA polymerase sigma-70 factor (ECF subfamily)
MAQDVGVGHAEELHRALPVTGDNLTRRSDEELNILLRDARDGDEDAFRLLYRQVQPRLLRYARTLVGDDAEDVTSEAWLHVAKDIASFRGDIDGFRAWVATIARHRALDHMRYHKRRPVGPTPTGELPEMLAADDTEMAVLDLLSTHAALTLISQLPADQAEIIALRVVVGLDVKAVAKILGKRSGAVRTATHRGLRRLEHLLNDLERL